MNMEDYFLKRRTIRKYSDKEISDQLLKELIAEASHAPTTGNMQLYSVVITRDKEMKRKLAPAHFSQPQVEGCNVMLTFCADFNRFVKWCECSNAVPGYDNLQSLVTAFLDTALFAQQFCVAAEMRGLGCCYLGTTTYNAALISEVLSLPDRVIPVTTITVGYPAETGEDVGRLPVEAIIHNETYHDYSTEDIISVYEEKEAREDSKRFVAENGKKSLAQVFTDVRYPKSNNEHFSKELIEYVVKHYPLSL